MTKQRQLILKIIRREPVHLNAEEIFLAAKQEMPSIVMATVYNNLNQLTASGMIRRIKISGKPDYFDREVVFHDHLICDGCGRIADAPLTDLLPELKKKTKLSIVSYELNLHYFCPECQANGKAPMPITCDGKE